MSDAPLARRTGWFLLSNAANAALSFLTLLLLARLLPPQEYGVLAVYVTFTAVLSALAGLSVDGSVSLAAIRLPAPQLARHVGSCVALAAAVGTALAAAFALGSDALQAALGLPAGWLQGALLCALAQTLCNLKLALWMARGAATRYAAFQAGQGLVLAGLTALLCAGFDAGWQGRAWAQLAGTVGFGALALALMLRSGECTPCLDRGETRSALRFGVPLLPHVGGALLFGAADRFVVNGLLGPAATGLYQFAAQIGSVVMILTDAINKAYAPWLYRHLEQADAAVRRIIVRRTYAYFAVALGGSALCFTLPWNLAAWLGGAAYAPAGALVPLFVLGHAIGGMYFMVVNYLFHSGRTGLLSAATLASGAAGLLLSLLWTPTWGAWGAALAFATAKLLHFGATWALAARLHPMPWSLRHITSPQAAEA